MGPVSKLSLSQANLEWDGYRSKVGGGSGRGGGRNKVTLRPKLGYLQSKHWEKSRMDQDDSKRQATKNSVACFSKYDKMRTFQGKNTVGNKENASDFFRSPPLKDAGPNQDKNNLCVPNKPLHQLLR